jgi:multimeric flavodoxin WrbA
MACDGCKKKSRCVQKDDMQRVYDLISESRALVLGSPVYFDQVSAQAKMFIDRLYCYTYTDQGVANFPAGYKGVVAIAYEDSHPARYVYVLEWLKERLEHYHKIEIIGSLSAGGTAMVPVSKREDLLGRAFELGRQLGQHVKTF